MHEEIDKEKTNFVTQEFNKKMGSDPIKEKSQKIAKLLRYSLVCVGAPYSRH